MPCVRTIWPQLPKCSNSVTRQVLPPSVCLVNA
jgi:hypothetical protein